MHSLSAQSASLVSLEGKSEGGGGNLVAVRGLRNRSAPHMFLYVNELHYTRRKPANTNELRQKCARKIVHGVRIYS